MSQLQIQSVNELLNKLNQDPTLVEKIKADPMKAIADVAQPAYITDRWVYRAVVVILGIVIITSAIGALILSDKIPDSLIALGSTAIGALAGLLAPSPTSK